MIESQIVDQWIYELLTGDTGEGSLMGDDAHTGLVTGVHAGVAPPDSQSPYIVFHPSWTADRKATGTARIMVVGVWIVKAVVSGRSYPAEIASRIDQILDGASGQLPEGAVIAFSRDEILQYPEVDQGREYRHLGGHYHAWVHQVPPQEEP